MRDELKIFTGNAHPQLAADICRYLGTPVGQAEVFEFSNENIFVRIQENIRERDVFNFKTRLFKCMGKLQQKFEKTKPENCFFENSRWGVSEFFHRKFVKKHFRPARSPPRSEVLESVSHVKTTLWT